MENEGTESWLGYELIQVTIRLRPSREVLSTALNALTSHG